MPLIGLAAGIVLAVSGQAFDIAYYRFSPGWESSQAEKRNACASPSISTWISRAKAR